jgi:hypothetical protein
MNGPPTAQVTGAQRVARALLTLSALGEIGVGAVGLAYPQFVALLLDATLDAGGLLVARMLGSAALALGITWWMARRETARLSRYTAGYIVYNLGVGALFALAALTAVRPALPWLVCIVHLVAGVGFGAAVAARGTSGD